jgi:hypothetical protein
MKTEYIECDGHLVYWMFGDRYEMVSGKHKVMDVVPAIGGAPGEAEDVVKRRIAQKIKTSYPQKITLSVAYEDGSEVAIEAPVEAVPEVPPAPEPETPKAKPAPKPAAKKATKAKK